VIPELNEQLRSQGFAVGDTPAAAGSSGALVKAVDPAKPKKEKKPNFEETSEEEEDDEDD
jgi:ribosomal protein L12E/L44/L45/RPP1/RPP2